MVSQAEVAKTAGVSPATVSLALNNHPRVSASTTLHVQTIAKRLGYIPNHAARQLIRARFGPSPHLDLRQVGVVSCAREPLMAAHLGATDMAFLNGVEQGVGNRAGILVYLRHGSPESARRMSELTRAGTVDGWIAFGYVGDEQAALLTSLARPWVALGDHAVSHPVHQVNLNFRLMGRLAARQLLDQGHRRLGFIGSQMWFAYPRALLAGFRAELAEAGLPAPPEALLLQESGGEVRSWLRAGLARLQALAAPPTAYVHAAPGGSETMLSVCADLGLRAPRDLSVVFCEIADGPAFVPGVTRIAASAVEAGRSAVSLLADIATQPDAPPRQLLVAPRPIPGHTVAPLPAPATDSPRTAPTTTT